MNRIKKFINFKQSLLEARGVTTILVPEDQIIDILDFDWNGFYEGVRSSSEKSDAEICPYCFMHNGCYECPMNQADNCCFDKDSTYKTVLLQLSREKYINNKDTKYKLLEDEFGCGKKI